MLHGKIPSDATPADEAIDPQQDRRQGSQRYVTVLKVGRAVVDGQDQLCLIRNMSAEGAKLELSDTVAADQKIQVELRSDRVISGTVRWSGDKVAGIQFDEPVNVQDMLQNIPARSILRKLPRGPRFEAEGRIQIDQDGGGTLSGHIVNISLHGLCAEVGAGLKAEERVLVKIIDQLSRRAVVRWVRDDMVGMQFENSLGYTELAHWLKDHRGQHQPA